MEFNRVVRSREHTVPIKSERRSSVPPPASTLLLLTLVFCAASVGCGTERANNKSADQQAAPESADSLAARKSAHSRGKGHSAPTTRTGTKGSTQQDPPAAARQDGRNAGATQVVRLTDRRCVQFEPQFTSIVVGQPITWSSELKQSVTIHVPTGAFDRTDFIVHAGASVNTGPARKPGYFVISSEPAACRGIPRGVQGAGPGLTVAGVTPGN